MVMNYRTVLKGTQNLSMILPLQLKKLRLEDKDLVIVSDIIDRRRMAKIIRSVSISSYNNGNSSSLSDMNRI